MRTCMSCLAQTMADACAYVMFFLFLTSGKPIQLQIYFVLDHVNNSLRHPPADLYQKRMRLRNIPYELS